MFLEKEAALDLPHLGVRFLADSNSWNVNGTPNVRCEADAKAEVPNLGYLYP